MSDYSDTPPTDAKDGERYYVTRRGKPNHWLIVEHDADANLWRLGLNTIDRHELRFGPRVPTPEELAELKRENHELRKMCRRLEQEVSDLSELSDCKETLREVGRVFGCDHVETADERKQLVNCAEQQFSNMDALRRDAERFRIVDSWARISAPKMDSQHFWRISPPVNLVGSTFTDAVDAAKETP